MTVRRTRPFRGAIVGFGNVAVEGHLPAWTADRRFAITAVCDADAARLERAAAMLPAARRYRDLDAMLGAERLDFVDVATPPATHADLVLAVLARRLHVLCEKPLALAVEPCNRIRSAASAAHAVVFTVHNWKYAPIYRTAKRLLRRGEIGRVHAVHLETARTAPPGNADGGPTWRLDPAIAGGGILVDHGWHAFYLAQYLLDAAPLAIAARTSRERFVGGPVEDTARCTITFPEATAEVALTWAASERRSAARVVGEQGTLAIDDRRLVVACRDRPPAETGFAQPLSAGSYHPDWFATMLDDFHAELVDPQQRGANFREAEACCALVALAYQSDAAGGTPLRLRAGIPAAEAPDAPRG